MFAFSLVVRSAGKVLSFVLRRHVKKPRLIIIGLCLASQSLCTKPVVVDGAQLTTLVEFTIDTELYVDEILYE